MGPYKSKDFKTLLLTQITFDLFQTSPFLLSGPQQSTVLEFGIFDLDFSRFWGGNFTFTIASYRETKTCYYLEKESSQSETYCSWGL